MFPKGFENAYAHEVERRKDEMHEAAKSRFERQYTRGRKPVVLPIAILIAIAGLVLVMFLH